MNLEKRILVNPRIKRDQVQAVFPNLHRILIVLRVVAAVQVIRSHRVHLLVAAFPKEQFHLKVREKSVK